MTEADAKAAVLEHDLLAALGILRSHARLLLDGSKGALTDEQRRSILAIERQIFRVERLVGIAPPNDSLPSRGSRGARPESLGSGVFPTGSVVLPEVLVADDDPDIREVLGELLGRHYRVSFAQDGGEALSLLRSQAFVLAIVDLNLPVIDGFELGRLLAESPPFGAPALMFLSAESGPHAKVHALSLGAVDYMTKPFDSDELVARVARIVAMVTREASLRAEAMTDPLTGLANYRSLAQNLDREIARSKRYGHPVSLLTLDLDHLKEINDAHGHDVGNDSIRHVARVLKGAVRSFELVARQGGDEFSVLLPNATSAEATRLAERLRAEISAVTVCGVSLSVSIGVAAREPAKPLEASELVKASDEALYRAKRGGRNRVEVTQ
ncbi:MAG TPA: diguanylate cyclase [Polyangiaceae bacterium]|nr:diguanylate cyclase [Polyangiaceae bacterium]